MRQNPAPLDPWPAVRVLAQAVGLREAARRFAEHGVTEAAARKRSQREGWAQDGPFGKAAPIVTTSPAAATAAQALAQELADMSAKSRLGMARASVKVAEHVQALSGAEVLDRAQDVKATAQTANMVFGWQEQPAAVKIRLDVLGGGAEGPAVQLEAEGTSWPELDDHYPATFDEY